MTKKKLRNTGIPSPIESLARHALRRMAVKNNVTHGSNFRAGRSVVISAPHSLRIGDHVSIGPRTVVQCDGEIQDFALIGMAVQIVGRDDHAIDEVGIPIARSTWSGNRPISSRDFVVIGRDVWIGGASIVLSGVSIGEGAVIGSGSVVTRDIPPYVVAAGNPARVIRPRFPDTENQDTHARALDGLSRELGPALNRGRRL